MRSYPQSGPAAQEGGPGYRGSGEGNAPGSGANARPAGRGRSATEPAWMTQGVGQTAVAPGSSPTGRACIRGHCMDWTRVSLAPSNAHHPCAEHARRLYEHR